MTDREFKRRILVVDASTGVSGVSTFLMNWLSHLDSIDVTVDIITAGSADKLSVAGGRTVGMTLDDVTNVGEIVSIYDGEEPVYREIRHLVSNLYPFLSKQMFQTWILESYLVLKKMQGLMNRKLYNAIFINDNKESGTLPVLSGYGFSEFMPVYEFTHSGDMFSRLDKSNPQKELRYATCWSHRQNSGPGYRLFMQVDPDNIKYPLDETKIHKMGMLLNLPKISQYQRPASDKEDRVLYIGRYHKDAKNPDLWIKTLAQTGLGGVAILPEEIDAKRFNEKLSDHGIIDRVDVYHSLRTYNEKMQQVSRCKCVLCTSTFEMFPFSVYENLPLMSGVCVDRPWSRLVNRELPFLPVVPDKELTPTVIKTVKEYSDAGMVDLLDNITNYEHQQRQRWTNVLIGDLLHDFNRFKNGDKTTDTIRLMEQYHEFQTVVSKTAWSKKGMGFEMLDVLYRHIDWNKVIHTLDRSFYGQVIGCEGTTGGLGAFF